MNFDISGLFVYVRSMISRTAQKDLLYLAKHFPAVCILGPRQCGKTTLAKAVMHKLKKQVVYLDFEKPRDLARLGTVPAQGSRQVYPSDSTTYTVSARASGGNDSRTVRVTVTEPPAPPPPPARPSERIEPLVQMVERLIVDLGDRARPGAGE